MMDSDDKDTDELECKLKEIFEFSAEKGIDPADLSLVMGTYLSLVALATFGNTPQARKALQISMKVGFETALKHYKEFSSL